MAITPPTPPTPPVAPTVPGAKQPAAVQQNPDSGNGTDMGREFGVHINISTPQGKQVQVHNDKEGQSTTAEAQQPSPKTTDGAQEQSQEDATAQQARQAVVQKMLGLDEKTSEEQIAQAQVQPQQAPWPLGGYDGIGMPIWPFVIIFLTAFGIFFLIQKSKAAHSRTNLFAEEQLSKGINLPKEMVEKAFAPKKQRPVPAAQPKSMPQQSVQIKGEQQRMGKPDNQGKQKQEKGSHFEIRI